MGQESIPRYCFVTANYNAAIGAADRLVTESRYDANGNVLALVLHNWVSGVQRPQVTSYEYDPYDRRTREILPDLGDGFNRDTITAYNRAGEIITVTDPKRQTIETDYDRAGRVDVVTLKRVDSTIEETRGSEYDKVGNLLSRVDLYGTSTYVYDGLNRLVSESRVTEGFGAYDPYIVQFWYDAVGNRTRVIYPDTGRTLVSHFDRASRLTDLYDGYMSGDTFVPVLNPSAFIYDSAGNRLAHTSPYGVVTTASFDALHRVESLTSRGDWGMASTPLYHIAYQYDVAGNRLFAFEYVDTIGSRDIVWVYDGLYRLGSEYWTGDAATQPQLRSYTYDAAGNRLTR